MSLKHKFQSTKTDSGDTTLVRPSNWNEEHLFAGGGDEEILVRDTADLTKGWNWSSAKVPKLPADVLTVPGAAATLRLRAFGSLYIAATLGVGTDTNTNLKILDTRNIEAATLNNIGDWLWTFAFGKTAANDNGKTIRTKFGGKEIVASFRTSNDELWTMETLIFRDTSGQVEIFGTVIWTPNNVEGAPIFRRRHGTELVNLTLDQNFEIEAKNDVASANDIRLEGLVVYYGRVANQ